LAKWRLLKLETADAYTNMAIDEAIMKARIEDKISNTLRFYQWNPSAVSIGRFQNLHDEIYVDGDLNMTAMVEEYGFQGSGSGSNPYIIENLSIVSSGYCIFIRNVEASFIIRNCQLKSSLTQHIGNIANPIMGHGEFNTPLPSENAIFIKRQNTNITLNPAPAPKQ